MAFKSISVTLHILTENDLMPITYLQIYNVLLFYEVLFAVLFFSY